MQKLEIKTEAEIEIMREGGQKLARVKKALFKEIREGKSAYDLEILANRLIAEEGARPSFKTVPGYNWATCVNVNAGLVHGIPTRQVVFKKGDVVSMDLGVYDQGFHTDTSFSVGIELDAETEDFLQVGRQALKKAIEVCRTGKRIYDISEAIQTTVEAAGFSPIRALVGHGIGRTLHQEPQIPCFVSGKKKDSLKLETGLVLAIEVMYAQGKPEVFLGKDGWTISMRDGKIAALFEETVAVTKHGPLVLTA